MAQKRPAQSTTEMNAGQAQLLADPQPVQQVLLNLLKNALDAQAGNSNPGHAIHV